MRRILFALIAVSVACGSDSKSGSTTGPSPNIPSVAGIWRGNARATSITGGDCLSVGLQSQIGVVAPVSLTITQSGTAITATLVSLNDGVTSEFTGTASNNAITLNGTFSSAAVVNGITCTNGLRRDMRIQTAAITGSVSGNTLTGDYVENWNVSSSATGAALGVLIYRATATVTR